MTEAATVFWMPIELQARIPGTPKPSERNRKFESVENAVTFVMQELSENDRSYAYIQTDGRYFQLDEIEHV